VSGESSGPCHAVIGLGLNLYLPPVQAEAIEQAWVDLQQILGEQIALQRNRWVALLLNEIVPVVADYQTRKLSDYVNEWRTYDCLAGQAVNIFMGEQVFAGIVRGVDNQGLLLLEDDAGNLRAFASGEVSFRAS
jgi:BirA family biotin operon repressor/biotin-[acetyl-CoA-carboxylase] ligase